MKNKRFTILRTIICTLSLAAVFTSCQKSAPTETPKRQQLPAASANNALLLATDSNLVPLEDAQMMAKKFTSGVFRGDENKNIIRDIASSYTIKDKNDIPALYIFNYDNNEGYIVMSADYRFEPICAFVEQGNLVTSGEKPSAFIGWFLTTIEIIEAIRDGDIAGSVTGNQVSWMKLAGFLNLEQLPVGIQRINGRYETLDCGNWSFSQVAPLLNTRWGQGCTYNNLVPVAGCGAAYCDKAPTGCVPTAGAMIAHYWAVPSTAFGYNYAAMPNDIGDTGVQRLMLNIGQIVNVSYGCNGSGAQTEDLRNFYQNYLYYNAPGSYDTYQSNSTWTIKTDLDAGRPVILDGCSENQTLFNWFSHIPCHAWVCDGYNLTANGCFEKFHLHMNWGWNGFENGFFYQSGDWPANHAYQYARNFLHNIHP